ncbi:MAG: hypothetical protein LUE10_06180, partial [Alistipes sp.]|nr:hypothetical protein [Alistipes sp.]
QLMAHIGDLMTRAQGQPDDVATLIELVEHFLVLQSFASAEPFARRAAAADPQSVRAHYLHSVVLHGLGRNEDAAASLETALALQDDPVMRYSLGVLYAYYLRQKPKAAEQFRLALEANPPEALRTELHKELDALK